MTLRGFTSSVCVAVVAAGGWAGVASAGQTIGQDFTPNGFCGGNLTFYPFAGPAPDKYTIHSAGVITSWRFTTATDAMNGFEFKVGHSGTANNVNTLTGDTTNLAANSSVAHPVRIPVAVNDRIGFYLPGATGALIKCSGGPGTDSGYLVAQGNSPPGTKTYNSNSGSRFPLSAQVEPDVDNDQFGDETQDACATNATSQAPCPPGAGSGTGTGGGVTPSAKDVLKPTLGSLGLSATTFRAARSGRLHQREEETEEQGQGRHQGLVQPLRGGHGEVHRRAEDQGPQGGQAVRGQEEVEQQEEALHPLGRGPGLVHLRRQGGQERLHLPRPRRRQEARDRHLPSGRPGHGRRWEHLVGQAQELQDRRVRPRATMARPWSLSQSSSSSPA